MPRCEAYAAIISRPSRSDVANSAADWLGGLTRRRVCNASGRSGGAGGVRYTVRAARVRGDGGCDDFWRPGSWRDEAGSERVRRCRARYDGDRAVGRRHRPRRRGRGHREYLLGWPDGDRPWGRRIAHRLSRLVAHRLARRHQAHARACNEGGLSGDLPRARLFRRARPAPASSRSFRFSVGF